MRLGKLGTSFHFSLGFHYLYRKNILIRAGSASGSAEQVGLTTGCSLSAFELLCVRYEEKHPVFIVDRHLPVHLCREPCCGTGNPGASGAGRSLFDHGRWTDARYELLKAREGADRDDRLTLQQIDYQLAVCALKLGSRDAEAMLADFSKRYPESVYNNDLRFAQGCFIAAGRSMTRRSHVSDG